MASPSAIQLIVKTLKEKSYLKHQVYKKTVTVFEEMRLVLKELEVELKKKVRNKDEDFLIAYYDRGHFEAEFKIAGDSLVFMMHTNVFNFDKEHSIWKTSYVQQDPYKSFCGMICVYNFLEDSFKYNRVNDLGYLIARIFVNNDMHYFVEGKRQLGFLYNDFDHAVLDRKSIRNVVESAILYSMDFDLYTPPYDEMKQVSVSEIIESAANVSLKTGKRLGFRFQADDDNIQ